MKKNQFLVFVLSVLWMFVWIYVFDTQKANAQMVVYEIESIESDTIIEKIEVEQPKFVLIDSNTTATIYHAHPSECYGDCSKPAAPGFTIDVNKAGEHKIIAMEKSMRNKYKLKWGDIVYIEGTPHDGYWQIQDAMPSKFAGQSRIDLLVSKGAQGGVWKNVKVYRVECSDTLMQQIRQKHMLSSL